MIITEILPLGAKKSKVLTDEDFAFSLYRGEIKKMELEVGRELTAEFLRTELYPLLIRRSRERLLYLLKQRDYTEAELKRKFREGFYPEEIAELALDYGRKLHYVDDRRVAETYIRTRSSSKSYSKKKRRMRPRKSVGNLRKGTMPQTSRRRKNSVFLRHCFAKGTPTVQFEMQYALLLAIILKIC